MIQFPSGHKAISPVSDEPSSIEGSKVLAQWNEVSADGKIDLSERLNNGALWKHIEVTLGYGSVQAFLFAHDFEGELDSLNVWDQKITLSPESKEAIRASIEGSIDNAHNYMASTKNKLPTDVDIACAFTVFTLPGGQQITFDGPGAGEVAENFVTLYNNSPRFRGDITMLANQQDGQYSFHMVPTKEGIGGFNISGTGTMGRNSGVFLSSGLLDSAKLSNESPAQTIIHEVAHDLHPGRGYEDDGTPHAGEGPHAREQTIYHGLIVNELKSAGIDINFDVDGDDYSHDSRVFGSKGVSSTDTIVVAGHELNALETYSKMYQYTKLMINEVGSYEEAKKILDRIPADAQITIAYDNPQENAEDTQVTYNVRELMLQDLMLSTDRADRMDMDVDDTFGKEALSGFFNFLTSQDAAWESTIQTAANDIFFDLEEEFPNYA